MMYRYTSSDGKRYAIYDSDLNAMREKEDKPQPYHGHLHWRG